MSFEERIRLIKKLDLLIKWRYKGNSYDYAAEMGISRSSFFRILDYIKTEFNVPVCYCKSNGYYEYCKDGVMFFGFLSNEVLSEDGMKKIRGGTRTYMAGDYLTKNNFRVSTDGTDDI